MVSEIVLKEILHPNDIDSLQDDFFIYRGCDISELESNIFGQSWTISESVARDFAFKHYSSQDWFDNRRRIVVKAKYRKCDTFYSDQTPGGEFEIAVNREMLSDIAKTA